MKKNPCWMPEMRIFYCLKINNCTSPIASPIAAMWFIDFRTLSNPTHTRYFMNVKHLQNISIFLIIFISYCSSLKYTLVVDGLFSNSALRPNEETIFTAMKNNWIEIKKTNVYSYVVFGDLVDAKRLWLRIFFYAGRGV